MKTIKLKFVDLGSTMLDTNLDRCCKLSQIRTFMNLKLGMVGASEIYITHHGLPVMEGDTIFPGVELCCHFRLRGGKGGFGSMLRAMGSQIEKTTNMEACRDLSGRRMRDVNNEKKMLEWVKKKAEQDQEKEREKIENLEKKLVKPKHFFNDPEYEKRLEETADNVDDALKKGLEARKRKCKDDEEEADEVAVAKKQKATTSGGKWLGLDGLSSSDDSETEEDEYDIPVVISTRAAVDDSASSSSDIRRHQRVA